MNQASEPTATDQGVRAGDDAGPGPQAGAATKSVATSPRKALLVLGAVALLALVLNIVLWERLSTLQEQLGRQSADAGARAAEARTLARQAQEQERDLAARVAVMDARFAEVVLQRNQLDELMQSLSRSRDESLVTDLESALRLAQQQAQLTGSAEPLVAALRTAERRLQRLPQARLASVQSAIARDLARIKAVVLPDIPSQLIRLDELVRLADVLPLANAVGPVGTPAATPKPGETGEPGWRQYLGRLQDEVRSLVRVSRIDHPDAVLMTPEQGVFVRVNLRLLLLNARLGLLARQHESARSDLARASTALNRYFDAGDRNTRVASELIQQAREQMKALELPRIDDTLSALATAAGR